jgi:transposase-like protein
MAGKKSPRTPLRKRKDFAEIEFRLACGESIMALAKEYDIARNVLIKHRKNMSPELKAAFVGHMLAPGVSLEKIKAKESEGLLRNLAYQRGVMEITQRESLADKDRQAAISAANVVIRIDEMIAKYLGVIANHSTQTVLNYHLTPQFRDMQNAIIQALEPYPDAALAVSNALVKWEMEMAKPIIDVTPAASPPLALPRPDDDPETD